MINPQITLKGVKMLLSEAIEDKNQFMIEVYSRYIKRHENQEAIKNRNKAIESNFKNGNIQSVAVNGVKYKSLNEYQNSIL